MSYKPMEESTFLGYLKVVAWSLVKGGIDYNLFDERGIFVCSIKILHGKGRKREVAALSVHKTEKKFKERGFQWPPRRK